MKKYLIVTTIISFLILFSAQASLSYVIDGEVDDWGINLNTAVTADAPNDLDSQTPSGGHDIDYVTEDNADSTGAYYEQVGPGYSTDNTYDAEAMYFDNDETTGYLAIVTGLPPDEGTYPAGDIAIDADGDGVYEYGIDVETGDIILLSDPANEWDDVAFSQHSSANPYAIADGAGTVVGNANMVYSSTAVNDHYVIEVSFLLADVGLEHGDEFDIHWTMLCGNDVLNLRADINSVPEPATMLLLGTGLIGIAGFSRAKMRKRSEEQKA